MKTLAAHEFKSLYKQAFEAKDINETLHLLELATELWYEIPEPERDSLKKWANSKPMKNLVGLP